MDEINILAATAAAAPNHCDGDSPVVCILGVSSDFFWNHFYGMWPSVRVDNAHIAHAHGEHFECSSHVIVGHFILHIHMLLALG